ncbi:hypothetical protein [Klenkia brasiliensis]|uniref:Uncharacterized protein n=1 Tax=Klenkia brasiliensis TaxID=333142 RepID=A0A1G7LEF4_9ACTN|nr:hypothetical protein [Klenkia brasiliensis]SDF47952.1 hypothetical protein SAMN05660324_0236 [Klenkia brasiliensis]
MTTTVCDALHQAGTSAATLSADTRGDDLFSAAGWLSTAVTEALEAPDLAVLAPL